MVFRYILFLGIIAALEAVDFLHQANAGVHSHDHGNYGHGDFGGYDGYEDDGGYDDSHYSDHPSHGEYGYRGYNGGHDSHGHGGSSHGYDVDHNAHGYGGGHHGQNGRSGYIRHHDSHSFYSSSHGGYDDDSGYNGGHDGFEFRHGGGGYGSKRRGYKSSRNYRKEFKPNIKQLLFIKASKFATILLRCSSNDSTLEEVCTYGAGPFTVFAPTDYAFDKLSDDLQVALEECNQTAIDFLRNHIVSGFVMSKEFKNEASFLTLNNDRIRVTNDGYATIASGSKILKRDLWAKNGVVHLVDCYLCFPFLDLSNTTEAQSIASDNNFQIFFDLFNGVDLFDHTDHTDDYNDHGYYSGYGKGCTFLIPTDDAFNNLPTEVQNFLMASENSDVLKELAKCHKIIGTFYEKSLHYDMAVKTKCGLKLWITKAYNGSIQVNGATLQTTDICTTNGVIHTIDRLIIPPDLYDEIFMLPDAYGDPCGHLCEQYERKPFERTTSTVTATTVVRTLTDTLPTAQTILSTVSTSASTDTTTGKAETTTQKYDHKYHHHHHHHPNPGHKELIKSLLKILLLKKGHIYDSLHAHSGDSHRYSSNNDGDNSTNTGQVNRIHNHFGNHHGDQLGRSEDGTVHKNQETTNRKLEGRLIEFIRKRLKQFIVERLLQADGDGDSHSLESASLRRGNGTVHGFENGTSPASSPQSNGDSSVKKSDLEDAEIAGLTTIVTEDPELMDNFLQQMLELDDVVFNIMEEVFGMDVKLMVGLLPEGDLEAPAHVQQAIQDMRAEGA
ncbi:uncharacterized protein LOC106178210 [Lingula anatina]|uniref:Uncharacterized protein LOC106178210 n=1 Tax=Lingula anatina TaxID=7574 RepID=A0A1S3K2Z1_LINAN|nr:uncharacterized protein LOC106178210 [Lingula anatina]|eukprot:XP_013416774.1 uncharacterized protein LOC106178210 [Lingula anatina]